MSPISRFYAGRLSGMVVRGPDSEAIGRCRDVLVSVRPGGHTARALGLVVEMVNRRQIFLPMLRIASVEPHEITLVSGTVSLRSFSRRAGELSVFEDLIGSKVQVEDPELEDVRGKAVEITDVELERTRTRDWVISRVAVVPARRNFRRRPDLVIAQWSSVRGVGSGGVGSADATADLLAEFSEMRAADIASRLHKLAPEKRQHVAEQLNDQRLADVLEEMPDDHQAEFIENLDIERAADILEEMDPDDAADLLGELPEAKADILLELMDPEESAPVRRLLDFAEGTVGAIMTPEPVILPPQTTVAEALAIIRNPELPTSLASQVYVVRPPTGTPTGHYLGTVHIQALLREPPSELIGGIVDNGLPYLGVDDDEETAARYFAKYNLVCAPVVDQDRHLLGAVAVDDLLDHLLPEDWRETGLRPQEKNRSSSIAQWALGESTAAGGDRG